MSIEKFNSKKYITSKYFEDIGNILDDGFIIADNHGIILVANKIAEELIGKNLINKNIFKLISNSDFLSLDLNVSNNDYDHVFVHELDDYLHRQLKVKIKKLNKAKVNPMISEVSINDINISTLYRGAISQSSKDPICFI